MVCIAVITLQNRLPCQRIRDWFGNAGLRCDWARAIALFAAVMSETVSVLIAALAPLRWSGIAQVNGLDVREFLYPVVG